MGEEIKYDFSKIVDCRNYIKTPCVVYDKKIIISNILNFFAACDFKDQIELYFAEKANRNIDVLSFLKNMGMGVDVASIEELDLARKIGFSKISMTSPFIQIESIVEKLDGSIYFDFDNIFQLKSFCGITDGNVDIGVRLKLPLNFADLETHGFDSRFGIDYYSDDFSKLIDEYHLRIKRLHIHIGEYRTLENVEKVLIYLSKIIEENTDISCINFGGGYTYLFADCGRKKEFWTMISKFNSVYKKRNLSYVFEPGMQLLLTAGFLITDVISENKTSDLTVLTVDASAWCLYSWNPIKLVGKFPNHSEKLSMYKICGASCYEEDIFIRRIGLKSIKVGDTLVFGYSGAYVTSMMRNMHGFKVYEYLI